MRTEEQVLKDFEKIDYVVKKNNEKWLEIYNDFLGYTFLISKEDRTYCVEFGEPITMQEHKLLNELFTIWDWL